MPINPVGNLSTNGQSFLKAFKEGLRSPENQNIDIKFMGQKPGQSDKDLHNNSIVKTDINNLTNDEFKKHI